MTELYRHLGEYTDVPAGDIGVGGREIGYLFGQYKRITNRYESGVLTGKGIDWGGALVRTEATGYGTVLLRRGDARARAASASTASACVVSGSGNVAIYAIEKVQQLGAHGRRLLGLRRLRRRRRAGIDLDAAASRSRRSSAAASRDYAERRAGARASSPAAASGTSPCEVALPCATQNELDGTRRRARWSRNGVHRRRRGRQHAHHARGASRVFQEAGVALRPGQGGQRRRRGDLARWRCSRTPAATRGPSSTPRQRLAEIMRGIHDRCLRDRRRVRRARQLRRSARTSPASAAVADAMLALGVI